MKPLPFTILFLVFAFHLLPFISVAQHDLQQDSGFFHSQKESYQKWLDHSGLGKTLKVQAVEVRPDELALYLAFPFSDADSVTIAWWQLKREFEQHSDLTLEEQLFYKMTHIMELRQSLGNEQLFDTYDTRVEPCFYRGIYFEGEEVKVDSNGCKSKIREIDFDPSDFSRLKKTASFDWNSGTNANRSLTPEELRQRFPKQALFDLISGHPQNASNEQSVNCVSQKSKSWKARKCCVSRSPTSAKKCSQVITPNSAACFGRWATTATGLNGKN